MNRRLLLRYGHVPSLLMLLATVAAAVGCASALATVVWVFKGSNIPAEFDGLRGKRVVVVCRPMTSSVYANPGVAKDISRQLGLLLQRHVRGIELVDQRKVAEWMDANTWDDYAEVGRALEADVVVGIDLEDFDIYQGQTLYQGKASFAIKVYDCRTGGLLFEKSPPQAVYPPNHGVSTQDQQESDFRREFVRVLSDQIARHFYPHDPGAAYWDTDAPAFH
jgi:hypothetical protein